MPQNNAAYLDPLRAYGHGDSIMAKKSKFESEFIAVWECRICFDTIELDGDMGADMGKTRNKTCKTCGKKTRHTCNRMISNPDWKDPTTTKKTKDAEPKYFTRWRCTWCKFHEITMPGRIAKNGQIKTMRCIVCQTDTRFDWVESVAENLGLCRNG